MKNEVHQSIHPSIRPNIHTSINQSIKDKLLWCIRIAVSSPCETTDETKLSLSSFFCRCIYYRKSAKKVNELVQSATTQQHLMLNNARTHGNKISQQRRGATGRDETRHDFHAARILASHLPLFPKTAPTPPPLPSSLSLPLPQPRTRPFLLVYVGCNFPQVIH